MKPIVFFDLETTGTSVKEDRIVQIAGVKVGNEGIEEEKYRLVNPGMPIPAAATEVHGISDLDVQEAPLFGQVAKSLFDWLAGCDLAGYNSDSFDVPMLAAEFARAGWSFPAPGTRLVDVMKIERLMNSHSLAATYRRYTGEELEEAHDALVDTRATIKVFQKQLERYPELPRTAEELDELCNPGKVDVAGKLVRLEGVVCWAFGKHRGQAVKDTADYAEWVLGADFPEETKEWVRGEMR